VRPSTTAAEAIRQMQQHGFSQLPVVAGNEVLGIFSYKSFATGTLKLSNQPGRLDELPVDEFLEPAVFARVTDDLGAVFSQLDTRDSVLIGEPSRLQGIATPMDVLTYLYRIASPFVYLQETERALRALIHLALTTEQFQECVRVGLGHNYRDREAQLPTAPEELSFGEYALVMCSRDSWSSFERVLGSTRQRVLARLKPINELRNDVLHFRRELTGEDYQTLVAFRDWLLMKMRVLDARAEEAADA